MSLDNLIVRLLYSYDCVIIPELGGFVTKYQNSAFNPVSYEFSPPSKVVGFNRDLKQTDGLLANELASALGISYQEAQIKINEQVNQWKIALGKNQIVSISGLGNFTMTNNGILFIPEQGLNFNMNSYGLKTVTGSYIKNNAKVIPIRQAQNKNSWVSYAAAIGLAITIGAGSLFANQQWVQPQLSSFLPLLNSSVNRIETVSTSEQIAPEINMTDVVIENSENVSPTKDENPSLEPPIETPEIIENTHDLTSISAENIETENTEIEKAEKEVAEEAENKPNEIKHYQVIGASFKVYHLAMKAEREMKRKGFENAKIIGRVGSYYMVAYDTFDSQQEALDYKRDLEIDGLDVFVRP